MARLISLSNTLDKQVSRLRKKYSEEEDRQVSYGYTIEKIIKEAGLWKKSKPEV